jgi:hypothetical protein
MLAIYVVLCLAWRDPRIAYRVPGRQGAVRAFLRRLVPLRCSSPSIRLFLPVPEHLHCLLYGRRPEFVRIRDSFPRRSL